MARQKANGGNGACLEYRIYVRKGDNPFDPKFTTWCTQDVLNEVKVSYQETNKTLGEPTISGSIEYTVYDQANSPHQIIYMPDEQGITGRYIMFVFDKATHENGGGKTNNFANCAEFDVFVKEEHFDYEPLFNEKKSEAQAIIDNNGVPGYPTEEALEKLKDTVESLSANASDDYQKAYNQLIAAIEEAYNHINFIPRTDVYYTITSVGYNGAAGRGSMIYNPNIDLRDTKNHNADYIWSTNQVSRTAASTTDFYPATELNDQDLNHLWGFIKYYSERTQQYYYVLYNVGKEQFATIGEGNNKYDHKSWIFSNTPAYITLNAGDNNWIPAPGVRFQATIPATGETYNMSMSPEWAGPFIDYYANGDAGVPMQFAISENVDVDPEITKRVEKKILIGNDLKVLINSTANIPFGNGLGEYITSDEYTNALGAAETANTNPSADYETLKGAYDDLNTAIANLQLNMPKANTFLRIKGKTSEKYIAESKITSGSNYNMSDATDATTIFFYDGAHLLNYSTGMYNGVNSDSWNWVYEDSAEPVAFEDGNTNGGYAIASSTVGTQIHFYDRGDESAPCVDHGSGDITNDARYRSWALEEVTALPVTIGTTGYASFAAPVATTIPDDADVTAYTATQGEGNLLDLQPINGGVIPANTGVVLCATPETTTNADFEITATESAAQSADENVLQPIIGAKQVTAYSCYVLANGNNGVGFYLLKGETPEAETAVTKGFKAYIPVEPETETETGANAYEMFGFAFGDNGELTGVTGAATATAADATLYDLQGRRVAAPQKGQLYIAGGKKVIY